MKKKIITSLCAISFLLFPGFQAFAANESSCIQCHTNDALMKSLHKPLPMPAGEGEG